jgi:hypothetical protein
MNEQSKIELKKHIEEYEKYLKNGQWKPQWRIEEVNCFIKLMNGVINGTDKKIA